MRARVGIGEFDEGIESLTEDTIGEDTEKGKDRIEDSWI